MNEALPQALEGDYRLLACKKATDRGAALLCEHRRTGKRVLAKVTPFPEEGQCLKNEYEILKRLERDRSPAAARFPRAVDYMGAEGEYVLVRDYIPGQSMEDYVESEPMRPGIRRDVAVRCAISVLEQLLALHHLRPPVIHRDIKPQNVILDEQGGFHLIDLGIARTPRQGDDADTLVMGTRLTAPPEQYGYRQTDERSDIYTVGVLLRYCLTQEYGEKADAAIDADLRAIVRRATRFDPEMRYQRAEDMLAALRRTVPQPKRKLRRRLIAAALAALLLALAVAALVAARSNRPYAFREPLIEQAVRLALQKPEGALTSRDLAGVTSIHIFGRQIYEDDSQFCFLGQYVFPYDSAMKAGGLWQENGEIATLDDLRAMPNLEKVCLYRQNLSDLSALRGAKLRELGIGYNPVTDLSPLAGNGSLEALNVSGLELADTDVLATLPHLRELSIGGTAIESVAALSGLPLETLNIVDAPFHHETLVALPGLKSLTMSKLWPDFLYYLTSLPLETLEITHAEGVSPRDLEAVASLKRLSYRTEEAARLSAEPLRFPALEELELKGVEAESLTCLSALSELRTLGLYETSCADYHGLEALDNLQTVWATAEQAAALEALYPDRAWEAVVAP